LVCVRDASKHVRRSRPECRKTDAEVISQPGVNVGHNGARLFVHRIEKLDLRALQIGKKLVFYISWNAENILNIILFQYLNEKFRPSDSCHEYLMYRKKDIESTD
jgi:hypothetical protein